MKHSKNKKAFSLIELSIVLIIISLLTAIILKGDKLFNTGKLKKAISFTQTSPVWDIINPDTGKESAVLWLDVIDKDSITMSAGEISEWRSKITARTAFQSTATNRPIYNRTAIYPFPVLSFDGTNDFLQIDYPPLLEGDDNYTIAAVWQRITTSGAAIIYEQAKNPTVSNSRGSLFMSGSNYGFNGYGNNDFDIAPYSANYLYATVMVVDNINETINIYHNNTQYTGSAPNHATLNLGRDIAVIGRAIAVETEYINGYIAEIIVFDTALSDDDALSVAKYLTNKYRIK